MRTMKSKRLAMRTATGLMLAGSVATCAWTFSEVKVPDAVPSNVGPRFSADDVEAEAAESLSPSRFASLRLQRPLVDPPPKPVVEKKPVVVKTKPKPPPRVKLPLTLIGTIINPPNNLAILSDSSGKFDVKAVGESLELDPVGMEIESIGSEQVVIAFNGNRETFELDRRVAGSSSRNTDKPRRNANRRNRP